MEIGSGDENESTKVAFNNRKNKKKKKASVEVSGNRPLMPVLSHVYVLWYGIYYSSII